MFPGIEPLIRTSSIVVVATFNGYRDARWNTTSGERPSTTEYVDSSYPVTIVRNVQLATEELLRGAVAELDGAYVRGGELGCDSVSYSNMPEMTAGHRAAFFFSPLPTAGSREIPQLLRVWPIDDNNVITTDAGAMTLAELREAVENTAYDPTDPLGTSPGTPEPTAASQ